MSSRKTASLISLLVLAGCGNAAGPKLVDREPLSVEPAKEIPVPTSGGSVNPAFIPFERLSANVKPLDPLVPQEEAVAPTAPLFTPEKEPNNTREQATPAALPAALQGFVDPLPDSKDGDHDYFSFVVEMDHPSVMEIRFTGVKDVPLRLEVSRDGLHGPRLLLSVDSDGTDATETLPNFQLTNGRYYLHVSQVLAVDKKGRPKKPAWNVQSPYRMEMELKSTSSSNIAEVEPNDEPVSALAVRVPVEVVGLANSPADSDWYLLDLADIPQYGALSVELLPDVGKNADLSILTITRVPILSSPAPNGRKLLIPNLGILEGAPSYYLVVKAPDNVKKAGRYSLTIKDQHLKGSFETEPNDSPDLARRIPFEEEVTGWLHVQRDVDWLRLVPPLPEDWTLGDEEPPPEDAAPVPSSIVAAGSDSITTSSVPPSSDSITAPAPPGRDSITTSSVPPGSDSITATAPPGRASIPSDLPVLNVILSGVPGVDVALDLLDEATGDSLGTYNAAPKGKGEEIAAAPMPAGPFLIKVSAVAGDNSDAPYVLLVRAMPAPKPEPLPDTGDAASEGVQQ